MRVAVIGAGRMGQRHAATLTASRYVERVVVADLDQARAERVAGEIGAIAAASPAAAIEEADAVVIASSTESHATLVEAAVERGRPVFVEKPLAFEWADHLRLVRIIEATGVPVQVGFQRRFDPAYREARRRVAAGEVGRLYLVRLVAHDEAPPPDDYIPRSGGIFRDSTIHDFDALRYVTGREVVEVYAAGSVLGFEIFAAHGDVDTVAAILRLDDGTLAVLGQGRHDPRGYDIRMEIVGSADSVSIGSGPRLPVRSLEPGAPEPGPGWSGFLERFEVAYRAEIEAWLDVTRGDAASHCSARDALEAMRVAVAAGRSLVEGRPVRIAEIV